MTRLISTLAVLCALAVAPNMAEAKGPKGGGKAPQWNGRHDNGNHYGWYKNQPYRNGYAPWNNNSNYNWNYNNRYWDGYRYYNGYPYQSGYRGWYGKNWYGNNPYYYQSRNFNWWY